MKRKTKIFLQRVLCFVLIASLVSQNGLQTVSARSNRPGKSDVRTEGSKENSRNENADRNGNSEKNKDSDREQDSTGATKTLEEGKQSEIISEIKGRRGTYSKEYLRSDNSRTVVVYPQQVHYETEDGSLVEIDNSLTKTNEGYENGSNSYEVVFTDTEENQGQVIYREDGYEIAWQMVELLDAGTSDGEDIGTGDGADVFGGDGVTEPTVQDGKGAWDADAAMDGEDVNAADTFDQQISSLARKNTPAIEKNRGHEQENNRNGKKGKSGKKKIYRPSLDAELTDNELEESNRPEDEGIHHMKQSRVTYEGYKDGVSVEYEPASDGIKENIILTNADVGNEFAFCIQTKGLVARLTEGNEIEFYDEDTKEVVYYFPSPFMIDNTGEVSYDAAYELLDAASVVDREESGATGISTLYIKIVLDEEWLGQATYPVTVDPVLKQCRAKNLLDSGCVVSNSTMRTDLYVGRNNTGTFRSYVYFALPELPSQSVVSEAILDLSGEVDSSNTHYIKATLVTEKWYNTSTDKTGKELAWNNQPSTMDLLDYAVSGSYFNITKAVRQWMSGTWANYGVVLTAYDESVKTTDKLTLQYSKNTPYLRITYRTAVGLEPYWGTHSTAAGTAGTGYINDYSGALTVVNTSVATAGNRFPMSISHVYNSNAADGDKWHLNYEETIKIPIDSVDIGTYPYVYTDSDGTEHYFKKKEVTYLLNGSQKTVSVPTATTALPPAQDEDGLKLYIVPVTDSALKSKYPLKLIDKSASTVKYFDVFGRLAMITDSNQFESGTNSGTKVRNCVTIGFESYGSNYALTTFQDALREAGEFKTQCHQSGVTATSSAYTTALNELVVQMEKLKKDPYARADYATAKHIRIAMTALAALNEVDSTPNKASIKDKSTAIYDALEDAQSRANTLKSQSNLRIKSVTDAVGNTASIAYNGSGQIVSITDPAYGGSATYEYSNGYLSKITFANGDKAYYSYNADGFLNSKQDTDGYKVSYTYGGKDNRIIEVTESHNGTTGQTYGITYNKDNSTTFRFSGVDDVYENSDDIQNIHVFDEQGRAVCIYSKSVSENRVLGATACTYQAETDNGGTRNKIKDTAVVGMHTNNLLVNHSFEYNDSKWTLYKNDTGTPESGALNAYSTAKEYIGTHSAYVNMAKRTTGTGGFKQNVSLAAGTYTFSGYVSAECISNSSAYLKVKTSSGTLTSNKITQATAAEFDNGWQRLEVTFTLSSPQTVTVYLETDCTGSKGAGKVYFDCAQLESGSVANDYNILEDGSFELTTSTLPYQWTNVSGSGIKKADERVTGGVDGSYCYHISGQPGKNKYLRFTTNLGGSKNGYVLSGWVKSNSTPSRDSRDFKAMAYCEGEDGDGEDVIYQATSHISSYSDGWKYFCLILPAAKWGSTKLTICFYDNIGDLYIDGLQLTRNDVQTKSYDSQGRITSSYTALKAEDYQYDDYNRVQKHVTAAGASNYYVYDKNNEVKKVSASIGPDTHYTYDKYGNRTVSQSYGQDATASTKTQYYSSNTYTANGNFPASSTDVAGNTTTYVYNEQKGQLLSTTLPTGSSAGNVTVSYKYDGSDRLSSVTQSGRSVGYTYNSFDELTGISHNGFTYGFTYDGFGNVLTTSIAGKVISTNQYAANNGSLVKTTLADGTTTSATYDAYGKITSTNVGNKVLNQYVYDNDGNISKHTDCVGNLTTKYDYNERGLIVRSEVYEGQTTASENLQSRMQHTYTKSGKVGGLSYQEKNGNVKTYTFTYANDELPTKSAHPDGSNIQWTYDVLRRNTKAVFTPKSGAADGKKLYTIYEYEDGKHSVGGSTKTTATQQVSVLTNKFGNTGSAVSRFIYDYDSWGNITSILNQAGKQRTYTYNAYGEVTKATEAYSNGTSSTYIYTYDAGGNILKEQVGNIVHTYKYDSVWKDKLVSYDGKAITYDVFGCPINYMGSAMTWDVNGNLTGITKGSNKISYTYLADGNRKNKTVNGKTTEYHYNNGFLLSETTGDETLCYYYDNAGRISSIGYKKGNNAEVGYFFSRNLQGDIIGVYRSSDSKLIGTYEYDLWGKLISVTEASSGIDTNGILTKNPFRYRGYYYDNETGFYNLNTRYYDPAIRRFINADSVNLLRVATTSVGCKNLFNYSENDPVNCADSNGTYVESAFDVVTWGASLYDVSQHPDDGWAWFSFVADTADVILPGVCFLGEGSKALRAVVKNWDDICDAFKGLFKTAKKADTGIVDDAAEAAIKSGSKPKNVFPENPDDLLPEIPRNKVTKANGTTSQTIQTSDNIRIRAEQHPLLPGETYNPRHHGVHYHVEYKVDPTKSWNNKNNVKKWYPEGYIPGAGSGFIQGETFPE